MCIIGGEFIRNKEDTKCIADKEKSLEQIILGAIKESRCNLRVLLNESASRIFLIKDNKSRNSPL